MLFSYFTTLLSVESYIPDTGMSHQPAVFIWNSQADWLLTVKIVDLLTKVMYFIAFEISNKYKWQPQQRCVFCRTWPNWQQLNVWHVPVQAFSFMIMWWLPLPVVNVSLRGIRNVSVCAISLLFSFIISCEMHLFSVMSGLGENVNYLCPAGCAAVIWYLWAWFSLLWSHILCVCVCATVVRTSV